MSCSVLLRVFLERSLCRYNVVGHVKFCLTFLAGLVVFNERLNQMQMFGTALAFCGEFVNIITA